MTKKQLDEFLKIKGEARGVVFQTDKQYVLSNWGQAGLEKLEEKFKEYSLDFSQEYDKKSTMKWYPFGKRIASLFLIKETFSLKEPEIKEMGKKAPKVSQIVSLLFKLFTPLKKFSKEIPRYWQEHYTVGFLEVKEVSEEKKRLVLELKDIKVDPLFCLYLEGYFEGAFSFLYPNVVCREEKCPFKGKENFHQYIFKW